MSKLKKTLKQVDIYGFKGLESVEVQNCGDLNALIGKNNSGKSSILHAIDMAGLALSVRDWNMFQPKIQIKDMFSDVGSFEINLTYQDDRKLQIKTNQSFGPQINPQPDEFQQIKTILILPDAGMGLTRRQHRTPKWVIDQVEGRNYSDVTSLDILYGIKFYAHRNERGLTPEIYQRLINEIVHYFPDLKNITSDRTEHDASTLTYTEYGKKLDILYSGTGLKHFLDVLLKTTLSGANIVLLDEPELGLHPDLQRQFIEYLQRLAEEKEIQFFLATHSPILLNYADSVTYYKVINKKGNRAILQVPKEAIHTLLSDLGLRPSDIFNQDICLLVEGASDVIFFEHVIRKLYKSDFEGVAIAVLQYGGSAAEGIVSGAIDVSNIISAQKYIFWIRDRDSKPSDPPSTEATKFKNRLENLSFRCHILNKREIDYYYPETVHVEAQQGDNAKGNITRSILCGDQGLKYKKATEGKGVCIPSGKNLRQLLLKHLTQKDQLDDEIRSIVEKTLIPWKKEIWGDKSGN